jgi:hypothetical protein
MLLTQAEMDFIYHFRHESSDATIGPAHQWLQDRGISESVMIPLLYSDQETSPRWLDRLYEDPAPPFQSPWSSREEFEARVWEALEAYPRLKNQPYALPGFRSAHSHHEAVSTTKDPLG